MSCPNFKLAYNGDCTHYSEEQREDDNSLVQYCNIDGTQVKLIPECEMRGE